MPIAHIPTGLKSFDELIPDCPGIPRGGLTVISGEAGTGKTEFLLQIARHALSQGISVYYSDPVDNLRGASLPQVSEATTFTVDIEDSEVLGAVDRVLSAARNGRLVIIDRIDQILWASTDPSISRPGRRLGLHRSQSTLAFCQDIVPILMENDSALLVSVQTPRRRTELPLGLTHAASLIVDLERSIKGEYTAKVTKSRWGLLSSGTMKFRVVTDTQGRHLTEVCSTEPSPRPATRSVWDRLAKMP